MRLKTSTSPCQTVCPLNVSCTGTVECQAAPQLCKCSTASFRRSRYARLFATAFNKLRDGPHAPLDTRSHCRGATDCAVNLAEVIIREVERDRSFKIF